MRQAIIVLGLGFGDEGKGKAVDWLASEMANTGLPLVVRFSGGHQAAHTVINDHGKHIHSSFPAGSLRGCDGYISEHCCVSPIHLKNEWEVIRDKNLKASLPVIHPLAKITTPYDIAICRARENDIRHGSCGKGIAQTFDRNIKSTSKLTVADLTNDWAFKQKNEQVKKYSSLGLFGNPDWKEIYEKTLETHEEEYFKSVEWFRENIKLRQYDYLNMYRRVIFEGSQGIMLDMDHGLFPHVTYANTTSKNAIDILDKMNTDYSKVQVFTYYTTRCYLTRHGNGPMPNEENLILKNTEHETCLENEWQGRLRYGKIDNDLLKHALEIDRSYNKSKHEFLCISCIDQTENGVSKEFKQEFDDVFESGTPRSEFESVGFSKSVNEYVKKVTHE